MAYTSNVLFFKRRARGTLSGTSLWRLARCDYLRLGSGFLIFEHFGCCGPISSERKHGRGRQARYKTFDLPIDDIDQRPTRGAPQDCNRIFMLEWLCELIFTPASNAYCIDARFFLFGHAYPISATRSPIKGKYPKISLESGDTDSAHELGLEPLQEALTSAGSLKPFT